MGVPSVAAQSDATAQTEAPAAALMLIDGDSPDDEAPADAGTPAAAPRNTTTLSVACTVCDCVVVARMAPGAAPTSANQISTPPLMPVPFELGFTRRTSCHSRPPPDSVWLLLVSRAAS
jgi:hypothetical protein